MIKKHKFITDMLKFASSAESPELLIQHVIEYVGQKTNSGRAYVFEDNNDGTFDNTYEWCNEGVDAEIDNLKGVPFEGLIDAWYEEYKKSRNIVIRDLEEYRPISESVYQILKPQNVTSLVTGPIEIDGKYIGFYGLDNPPVDVIEDISELIEDMEFILVMLIKMRDYSRRLEKMAAYDQLTGCKNRAALSFAYKNNYDHDKSVGVIMCDLNGLKKTNDKFGHAAGDKFICDVADILCEQFERNNVYRLGGDEFAVFLSDCDEEDLYEKIQVAKDISEEKHVSFSIGCSYSKNPNDKFEDLLKEADKQMYLEKQKYYKYNF